jgi:solute carrier family 35, member C2
METPYSDRLSRPASVAPQASGDDINPRRKYRRRGTGSVSESKDEHSDDGAGSDMSESEEHELGLLDSDSDIGEDDAEAGLGQSERRKYVKRKRRRDGLDARIAGTAGMSEDEAKEADKNVMRKIITNAILIGLWYFFSLSISIVSAPHWQQKWWLTLAVQQDDVLIGPS